MGIEALPRALAESVPSERVALERPVAEIDLGRHMVIMEDGARVRYERLISTLPLPVLGRSSAAVQRTGSPTSRSA